MGVPQSSLHEEEKDGKSTEKKMNFHEYWNQYFCHFHRKKRVTKVTPELREEVWFKTEQLIKKKDSDYPSEKGDTGKKFV